MLWIQFDFDPRKFSTMSAHICLQHDDHNAERHAVRLHSLFYVDV